MPSRRAMLAALAAVPVLSPVLAPTQVGAQVTADPLAAWNEGPRKKAILDFVRDTTDRASPRFVPPEERVATFDNDGTLWAEQPLYVQIFFALDRVKALAPERPEWKTEEPFASLLKGEVGKVLFGGEEAIVPIVVATHSGMTTEEFDKTVRDWIAPARHPVTKRLFTEMVYQPMLELV